jgi:hypothetical protein
MQQGGIWPQTGKAVLSVSRQDSPCRQMRVYSNRKRNMNKINLKYSDTESGVNITRHKSYFRDEASDYLRVERKTADIESLIAVINRKETGVNQHMIMHCATLIKEAVITKLNSGNAVDVFGLGTLYLTACPSRDDTSQTDISVGFTPSQEARDAVAGIDISVIQEENTEPVVNSIKNLYTQQEGDLLSAGYSVRLSGLRMKIAGDETSAGVFLAPCDDQGIYKEDGSDWIQVKEKAIETNMPATLSFYLPPAAAAGKYRIIIKTASQGNGCRINKTRIRSAVYRNVVTVA